MARPKDVAKIYGAAFYFAYISRNKQEIAHHFDVQKRTVTRWSKQPEWEQALKVWKYEGERTFLTPPRRDIAKGKKEQFEKAREVYIEALSAGEPTHKLATIAGEVVRLPRTTIHRWAKQHGWREPIFKLYRFNDLTFYILQETTMKEKTDSELNRRISMARYFLDSAQLLERTTNAILAGSMEQAKAKADDTRFGRKMTAHFLYSIVFELCIKIIWECERNITPKPTHDIFTLYEELSNNSKRKIAELYDKQIRNTKAIITASNSGIKDSEGDIVNLSVKLQSLQDALASNQDTIKNFKYDGRLDGKSSAFCSVLWTNDEILILPKPEFIIFPKILLDYAISLKDK